MGDSKNNPSSEPESYVGKGMFAGMVVGVIGGSMYAMSDLNPNKGSFLSIETNLILFSCPIVGALLGYLVDKLRG